MTRYRTTERVHKWQDDSSETIDGFPNQGRYYTTVYIPNTAIALMNTMSRRLTEKT